MKNLKLSDLYYSKMKINPYELIEMRRKIKKYEDTGIQETMKLVKKLREMSLDPKMLQLT